MTEIRIKIFNWYVKITNWIWTKWNDLVGSGREK